MPDTTAPPLEADPFGAPVADTAPRPAPPRTPMQGRWCRLEPLAPERHANALFKAYSAPSGEAGWTWLPYGPFDSRTTFGTWLQERATTDDPLFHAILDPAGERTLGLASYLRVDRANGVIEVGHIHYAPALQRTPAATEAMFLMMRRAFDELGYRRYEWKCNARNGPSCRAAERLGFTYEGTFRQAAIVKGRNRDTAWYSLLDHEWPARRFAFERWLDPANIDERGVQRRPLERNA